MNEHVRRPRMQILTVMLAVMVAALLVWLPGQGSFSAEPALAVHAVGGAHEDLVAAADQHVHAHDSALPDCAGSTVICYMMHLCHPAMLVDLSALPAFFHTLHAVAEPVAQGVGSSPAVNLPPPRNLQI